MCACVRACGCVCVLVCVASASRNVRATRRDVESGSRHSQKQHARALVLSAAVQQASPATACVHDARTDTHADTHTCAIVCAQRLSTSFSPSTCNMSRSLSSSAVKGCSGWTSDALMTSRCRASRTKLSDRCLGRVRACMGGRGRGEGEGEGEGERERQRERQRQRETETESERERQRVSERETETGQATTSWSGKSRKCGGLADERK
jgi:hypothetical protein